MDESVRKYLQEKYGERLGDINTAQAFANLGDVIAGQKVGSTSPLFSEQRALAEKQTLGEIERADAKALKEMQLRDAMQNRLFQQEMTRQGLELKKQGLEQTKQIANQGKQLPIAPLEALGEAEASIKALDEASNSFEANKGLAGPQQSILTKVQKWGEFGDVGQKAKSFDAELRMNAQTIGKYLEGGKMTDADIDRYMQMLPNLSDSYEVATKKTQLIKNRIAEKQSAQLRALKAGGYNVGNLQSPQAGPNPNVPAETKIINGETFQKVPGGWQKVGK